MCPYIFQLCNELNITAEHVFKQQLCSRIEIKLREFNLKLLYGILPCNVNLVKWRKKDSDLCDICDCVQTIKHLLFDCHRANILWKLVEATFDITLKYCNIVCGIENISSDICNIVTLLSFLLYKEWLLCSLESKSRSIKFPFQLYIYELSLRKNIYLASHMSNDCIDTVIQCLEGMNDR